MQFADYKNIRLRAKNATSGDIGKCPWSGYPVKAAVGEIRQYWSYLGEKPTLPEGYENVMRSIAPETIILKINKSLK